MKDNNPNYASEVELLKKLEFGERFEPGIRIVAVGLAGILTYIYTGWISALVWPAYFIFALTTHSIYIATRGSFVSHTQVAIGALLFANLQAGFGWFPTMLFIGEQTGLMLVGVALVGAQLLFLVRRSDTLTLYHIVQVSVVIGGSVTVYIAFLPSFDTTLSHLGPAFALIGLNFYFVQTLRLSRRMRLSREEAARHAHQAQKMASIGQLAGGVAHDFNNNLTAIIGSIELAQQTDDPREQKIDLENALVAAHQAATTVKHLMIYARKERPDISEISVVDVFEELETLTQRLIPTSIAFSSSSDDPQFTVNADQHQLLAGMINLVVNSVDAMPNGGVLTLWAEQARITYPEPLTDGSKLDPGDYVHITLKDDGHGIPKAILMDVIDPFFTTKPVGKGTGLGLSMVAGMMKEFGGGLSIQSDEGGTEVSLFLPKIDPHSDA